MSSNKKTDGLDLLVIGLDGATFDVIRPVIAVVELPNLAALVEQAVRMAGRQEKISTSFPAVSDLIREADFWADQENQSVVGEHHVDRAIEARIFRSNLAEERIQEMIDRGTLMIDVAGEVVGQVNGLAVYSLGDYMFGKPSRITARRTRPYNSTPYILLPPDRFDPEATDGRVLCRHPGHQHGRLLH